MRSSASLLASPCCFGSFAFDPAAVTCLGSKEESRDDMNESEEFPLLLPGFDSGADVGVAEAAGRDVNMGLPAEV